MKKLFAAILVVCSIFVMPIAQAEVKTYIGKDEYFIGERETIEQAKEHSKTRALRNAREQAGVYIKSRSHSIDLELVEDEIITIAEGVIKIVGTPHFEQRTLEGGKGILLITTINVEIDTDEVNNRLEKFEYQHFDKKIEEKPSEVDNIALSDQKTNEAIKLCDNNKFREAISVYNAAIQLNPNNVRAYHHRADSYQHLKNHLRSYSHSERKNFDKAISDYKKCIELEPNAAYHYECLARAYNSAENYHDAIFACNKAIELNHDSFLAYERIGAAYNALKKYNQTISYCTKAIEINPKWEWSYVNRARAYESLGEHEKARADFAKARQLGWKG